MERKPSERSEGKFEFSVFYFTKELYSKMKSNADISKEKNVMLYLLSLILHNLFQIEIYIT